MSIVIALKVLKNGGVSVIIMQKKGWCFMTGFKEGLSLLLEKSGLTFEEVMEKLGIGQMTLVRYLNGYLMPSDEELTALAELFGVPKNYLTGESDAKEMSDPIYKIPVFNEFPSGEKNDLSDILPIGHISGVYTKDDAKSCYFIIVKDDLMLNAKAGVGDKALINTAKQPVSGDVAAVSICGEEPIIRRIFFSGPEITLRADGPIAWEEKFDIRKDDIKIIGKMEFALSYPT